MERSRTVGRAAARGWTLGGWRSDCPEAARDDGARIRLRQAVPLAQGPEPRARPEAGAACVSPSPGPEGALGQHPKLWWAGS